MRRLADQENVELRKVLETLLAEDADITVREVARRHPSLRNASAFTRNPQRLALIEQAQQRQADARKVKTGAEARRSESLAELLEQRNRQIVELELRVKALVASHAACIRAVMHHGGMRGLENFWASYKSIADTMRGLDAMPDSAEVIGLPVPGGTAGGKL